MRCLLYRGRDCVQCHAHSRRLSQSTSMRQRPLCSSRPISGMLGCQPHKQRILNPTAWCIGRPPQKLRHWRLRMQRQLSHIEQIRVGGTQAFADPDNLDLALQELLRPSLLTFINCVKECAKQSKDMLCNPNAQGRMPYLHTRVP